ncbi:hypothetical protein [Priestia koreensis]|uniref:hypothetical protein n=1 Tax=Priestia koreensis TaxID=284581 RepID=UPI000B30D06F|nr:hypothetical protein [Priestia koreensis]
MGKEREKVNGSMAEDWEELKKLGKEMENLKTNQELQEEGVQPDPVQHKEK